MRVMFETIFLQFGSEGGLYEIFMDIGRWFNDLTGGLFFGDLV